MLVFPVSGGASDKSEGTTVRSSMYVVSQRGGFLSPSLVNGRTSVGTSVRGIIYCPGGRRHPVGRAARVPGCLPSRDRPTPTQRARPRHPPAANGDCALIARTRPV